jgi:hypothetical protein
MGSTETDSTDALPKMFTHGSMHAVAAGSLSVAAEMFHTITAGLDKIKDANRNHGTIWKSINNAVNGVRSEKFFWEVLQNEHIIQNEIIGRIFANDPVKIQEAWAHYYIGADLVIGTFDNSGAALLYYVGWFADKPGLVHFVQYPGHHSIGTGSPNATQWLNFRNHAGNCGVKRAAYHAYEASKMAAAAPTVNNQIEITIATKNNSTYIAKDRYYPGWYGISFSELEELYRKYGPQSTEGIEFSAPS